MAKQRFEKGSEMHEFFGEYFQFVQNFWIVEDDEQYWKKATEESKRLSNKYKHRFCRLLISSYMTYLGGELNGKNRTSA